MVLLMINSHTATTLGSMPRHRAERKTLEEKVVHGAWAAGLESQMEGFRVLCLEVWCVCVCFRGHLVCLCHPRPIYIRPFFRVTRTKLQCLLREGTPILTMTVASLSTLQ